MPIQWTNDLASGVEKIDTQHKLIIAKIGELLVACKHGAGCEETLEMIEFMEDYCKEHFKLEQEYMREYNYPYAISHARQHRECTDFFIALKKDVLENGVNTSTVVKINKHLVGWFITHIRYTDVKLGTWLKEKMA